MMYELVSKFRRAIRWLVFGAGGLAIVWAIIALTLPFLIEDRSVHAALIRSLSAWSGGPVEVHGPFRVASFTSLSIEAKAVRFSATPRLLPIGKAQAKSVTAILSVRALLGGRIEFRKVAVESAQFVFSRQERRSRLPFFGLESAREAVAFADRSRFEVLELHDSAFFIAEGEGRPYSRFRVEWMKFERGRVPASAAAASSSANAPPFTLQLRDPGFEAFFRGTLSPIEQTAQGSFRLTASAEHPASRKIAAAIVPWEQGHSVSLAGDLTWSGSRASLDGAVIAFGDRSARGSLALAARHGRPLLEGTLAYDRLEWANQGEASNQDSVEPAEPLRALAAGREHGADLDMRISAERFRAGTYEAGPLALALTARPGHFSIDIAELALFGGKITGRIDYDSAHPAILALNAAGTGLNSQSLTGALSWPFSVSGPVTVRVALNVPFGGKPLAGAMRDATGNFAIKFPYGGALDGDLSQHLSTALAQQDLFWGLGSSSFPFSIASLEGTAEPGGVAFKFDGEHDGGRIGGSLRIASPGNSVSGTLSLSEAADAGGPSPSVHTSQALPPPSQIVLSGTVTALNFSPPGKPSLSN
ncbi:MAG: hypothetical protein ACLPIX_13545 [Rhodomicrobium sp.]